MCSSTISIAQHHILSFANNNIGGCRYVGSSFGATRKITNIKPVLFPTCQTRRKRAARRAEVKARALAEGLTAPHRHDSQEAGGRRDADEIEESGETGIHQTPMTYTSGERGAAGVKTKPAATAFACCPSYTEASRLSRRQENLTYLLTRISRYLCVPPPGADANTTSNGTTKKPTPAQVSAVSYQTIARPTRLSRSAHSAGLCPSAEINLVKRLRQAALAEAEASGTGRRARAPSRRAIEAAGMADGEQWIKKERTGKEARKPAEAKKEQKAVGVAAVSKPSASSEGCVSNRDASGAGSDGSSIVGGAAGDTNDRDVVGLKRVVDVWRTITPTEIDERCNQHCQSTAVTSRANRRQQPVNIARVAAPKKGQANVSSDEPVRGIDEHSAAGEAHALPARRLAKRIRAGNLGRSNLKHGAKQGTTETETDKGNDGSTKGSGGAPARQTCLFEGCVGVATHGVPGIARFW